MNGVMELFVGGMTLINEIMGFFLSIASAHASSELSKALFLPLYFINLHSEEKLCMKKQWYLPLSSL
jgi:hypothetical protein